MMWLHRLWIMCKRGKGGCFVNPFLNERISRGQVACRVKEASQTSYLVITCRRTIGPRGMKQNEDA